jgi:cytochrome c-type biogenesis protein CcmE
MTTSTASSGSGSRAKFIIGGLLIVAAVVYLIVSSTQAAAQYYLTIDEMLTRGDEVYGRAIKLAGAVDGESVSYDTDTLTLEFSMANVPADLDEIEAGGGLAKVLYDALRDPNASRLQVVYVGPKPDLLRHEAQAIVTGNLGDDGVFYADELLLKCPTRYEEEVSNPQRVRLEQSSIPVGLYADGNFTSRRRRCARLECDNEHI